MNSSSRRSSFEPSIQEKLIYEFEHSLTGDSITLHQTFEMGQAIFLRAGGSPRGFDHLPAHHIKSDKPVSVPCRTYSNSRLNTWPGCIGKSGCLRSKACTPVNSSMLMVRSPYLARSHALLYTSQLSTISHRAWGQALRLTNTGNGAAAAPIFLADRRHVVERYAQQYPFSSTRQRFLAQSTD